jgi:TRAP-type C4-dicarboxylate transport system substrate-binding protein
MKAINQYVFGAALTLVASSAVLAAKWDMPTPYGDANHPTQVAIQFAKDVGEATKGKLTITVHSGGSLIKHPEIPRAVKTGQVQIGEIFVGRMGNTNPVFKIDNIPFLATNYDDAKRLHAASKDALQKALDKEGMQLLYTVAWPAQSLYSKAAVKKLSDLDGVKMRAYSPSTSRLADLMGTTPVNVPFSDIAQAFSTSVIDAMITSPSTGANGQSWDYVKHYTDIQAWIPKNMVVVNKKAFKRLDGASQKAVLAAANKAQADGWRIVREKAVEHTNVLKENGTTVAQPSQELLAELTKIGKTMTAEWLLEIGDEGKEIMAKYNNN